MDKKMNENEEIKDNQHMAEDETPEKENESEESIESDTGKIDENVDCEPEFKIRILENKLQDQEEALMRVNAEYSNYRRRTQEEKQTIALYANEKIMTDLLPVIDNMQRAMDACEDKESQLYKGVELVHKQLMDALKNNGLEEIKAEIGSDFDHNVHMAVMQEPSDEHDEGKITMVLQNGYKVGKKVVRASMVKVSCK